MGIEHLWFRQPKSEQGGSGIAGHLMVYCCRVDQLREKAEKESAEAKQAIAQAKKEREEADAAIERVSSEKVHH